MSGGRIGGGHNALLHAKRETACAASLWRPNGVHRMVVERARAERDREPAREKVASGDKIV